MYLAAYIPTIQYAMAQYIGTNNSRNGTKSINTLDKKYADTR